MIFTIDVIGTKEGHVQWEAPDPNHRNRDPVPSMATAAAGPDCLCQGCLLLEEDLLPFPLDQPQALDNL